VRGERIRDGKLTIYHQAQKEKLGVCTGVFVVRSISEIMRTIFLLDIDCFFASVEMALHPELKGRPLCIGGRRGSERGIVACPNYEARAYGVRTAMPLRTAARLLPPDAVFLPGNHKLYGEYSERVMNILYDFTPDIEQVSVDEAYMDVTGCLHLWDNDSPHMAAAMKERIRRECGLGVSIGIASNKVCAKIAAGLKKPNGLVVVPHGQEKEFLAPLPIEVVPGVGTKTLPKLHAQGIFTVADILHTKSTIQNPQSWLIRYLNAVANGRDEHVMQYDRVEQSISRDTTFGHDTNDISFVTSTLYYLTERCCKTLRKRNQVASTVTVKVRFTDFTTVQKQTTLHSATANEEEVFAAARHMLLALFPRHQCVRLVGVKVSRLLAADRAQMQLDPVKSERSEQLHRRLDALQAKHGYTSIQWGITYVLHETFRSTDNGYELHSPVYEL
jgi:DNA polymerase IV